MHDRTGRTAVLLIDPRSWMKVAGGPAAGAAVAGARDLDHRANGETGRASWYNRHEVAVATLERCFDRTRG